MPIDGAFFHGKVEERPNCPIYHDAISCLTEIHTMTNLPSANQRFALGPILGLFVLVSYGALTVAQTGQKAETESEQTESAETEKSPIDTKDLDEEIAEFPVSDVGVKAGEILIELTNAYREENELEKLSADDTLQKACRSYAITLANRGQFGHEVDGSTPAERTTEAGYKWQYIAENLLYREGYTENNARELAEFTLKQWQESPGHNKNLLASQPSECGVAVFIDSESKVTYVTMLYGFPKDAKKKLVVDPETGETVKKMIE